TLHLCTRRQPQKPQNTQSFWAVGIRASGFGIRGSRCIRGPRRTKATQSSQNPQNSLADRNQLELWTFSGGFPNHRRLASSVNQSDLQAPTPVPGSKRIVGMDSEDDNISRPTLDPDLVGTVVGQHLQVGLTFVKYGGEVIEQKQLHGTVERINDLEGIVIRLPDGTLYKLPPDLRGIKEAAPGVHRLRSTGEEVVNPDYVYTWKSRGRTHDGGSRSRQISARRPGKLSVFVRESMKIQARPDQ